MNTSLQFSRRTFVAWVGGTSAGFYLFGRLPGTSEPAGARADPGRHAGPRVGREVRHADADPAGDAQGRHDQAVGGKPVDYYEISMRQFTQQILPAGLPATTVWGYGAGSGAEQPRAADPPRAVADDRGAAGTGRSGSSGSTSSWTRDGNFLPHLLPVDPTLHWANPPGGVDRPRQPADVHGDARPATRARCRSSPTCTARSASATRATATRKRGTCRPRTNIPAGYATEGTWYDFFAGKAAAALRRDVGTRVRHFQYPNANRASTIWYHDHALGMTRLNVYAGPAGFYLIRGGPRRRCGARLAHRARRRVLPGPGAARERQVPAEQARTTRSRSRSRTGRSTTDGSLFYPDTREFFDGIAGPYIPDERRSRRSGTRSSSATRSWSTATPGRS